MTITDYCSENIRDAYDMCGAFDGDYHTSYLFSIDDEKMCEPILKIINKLGEDVKGLNIEGGFVFNYKYKTEKGYIVVQDLFNSSLDTNLCDTLEYVAAYLRKIPSVGGIKTMVIDNYDEGNDSGYHCFNISFILPNSVVYDNRQ